MPSCHGSRLRWRQGVLKYRRARPKWRRGILKTSADIENLVWQQLGFLRGVCGVLAGIEFLEHSLRLLRRCAQLPREAAQRRGIMALLSLGIAFGSDTKEANQWRSTVRAATGDKKSVCRAELLWLIAIGQREELSEELSEKLVRKREQVGNLLRDDA